MYLFKSHLLVKGHACCHFIWYFILSMPTTWNSLFTLFCWFIFLLYLFNYIYFFTCLSYWNVNFMKTVFTIVLFTATFSVFTFWYIISPQLLFKKRMDNSWNNYSALPLNSNAKFLTINSKRNAWFLINR